MKLVKLFMRLFKKNGTRRSYIEDAIADGLREAFKEMGYKMDKKDE